MATYRYIAKIKNIVNDGLYNGVSTFSFYSTGDEAAQQLVSDVLAFVPNYPVYQLSRVIEEMGSDILPDDASNFTDVYTYRFGLSDGQIVYLNVTPTVAVATVMNYINQNFKDKDGEAITVKSMSMKGKNVVVSGAVIPPSTALT